MFLDKSNCVLFIPVPSYILHVFNSYVYINLHKEIKVDIPNCRLYYVMTIMTLGIRDNF